MLFQEEIAATSNNDFTPCCTSLAESSIDPRIAGQAEDVKI